MTCGVYQITNTVTGRKYIGGSIDCEKKLKDHFDRLERGEHDNAQLQLDWQMYEFRLEIAEHCTFMELYEAECRHVNDWPSIYNFKRPEPVKVSREDPSIVRGTEKLILRACQTLKAVERSPYPREPDRVVWPEMRMERIDYPTTHLNTRYLACSVDLMDTVLDEFLHVPIMILSRKIIWARFNTGRLSSWRHIGRKIGRSHEFCRELYRRDIVKVCDHFMSHSTLHGEIVQSTEPLQTVNA